MTSPKRRKCFSIEEKSAIIQRLEAGESNASLAKELGVCQSTISTILRNKNKIKSVFNLNILSPKRMRKSSQKEVEEALMQWFKVSSPKLDLNSSIKRIRLVNVLLPTSPTCLRCSEAEESL